MTEPPAKRGVLYIVWNRKEKSVEWSLQRSIASVKRHHPELPIKVHELDDGAQLLSKSRMLRWTPFEQTLYLDADTIVMDRLDFGFDMAERHHLAMSICEAPYASRYHKMITGDVVEYNTGVMFFRNSPPVRALFADWERIAFSEDSASDFLNETGQRATMPHNDQAGFAKAVHLSGFNPFVLPCNWNLRARWMKIFFGPVKVWHDFSEPPGGFEAACKRMKDSGLFLFGRLPG